MAKQYHTRQETAIRAAVEQKRGVHFTAEELAEALKTSGIGLSTIYRHLDRMTREGLLRRYSAVEGESACYQQAEDCGEHFHLKCARCGKLEHLECEHLEEISRHVAEEHGFRIDPSRTVFFGLCEECAEK